MVDIRDFDEKGICFKNPRFQELFWSPDGEKTKARIEREAAARLICGVCEVTDICLEYALERESPGRVNGFFGGKNEDERRAILNERKKAAA